MIRARVVKLRPLNLANCSLSLSLLRIPRVCCCVLKRAKRDAMFCRCQRYTNGGRRGSFSFVARRERKRKRKKIFILFFEKNADSWTLLDSHRRRRKSRTHIKREESERKEEEERESLASLR